MSRSLRSILRPAPAVVLTAALVGCTSASIRHAAIDRGDVVAPEVSGAAPDWATTDFERHVVGLVGDLTGVSTVERALARQALVAEGTRALPVIGRLAADAELGSFRGRALMGVVESIHRRLAPGELADEIRLADGMRQRSAIRVAVAVGREAVPALIDVVAASQSPLRHEAIIALRRITTLHPMRRDPDPASAILAWRAWYEQGASR